MTEVTIRINGATYAQYLALKTMIATWNDIASGNRGPGRVGIFIDDHWIAQSKAYVSDPFEADMELSPEIIEAALAWDDGAGNVCFSEDGVQDILNRFAEEHGDVDNERNPGVEPPRRPVGAVAELESEAEPRSVGPGPVVAFWPGIDAAGGDGPGTG